MKTSNKQYPYITIVVPMRNEERYIKKCISSFFDQDYPTDRFEIIVVDGLSQDNSVKIVTELIEFHNNIKIFNNKNKITPIALNIGIRHAKGDLVIIFSAHGFAGKKFLLNNVKAHTNEQVDCIGGTIKTLGEDFQSKAISLAQSSIIGVGNSLFRYSKKSQFVDTVAFGAYTKKIFNKIGNFDEALIRNQDFEFNHRIIKNGGKILLDPSIKSYYYARSSIWKLFNQYFQYGFWKVRVVSKHKDAFKLRYQVPSLFVLVLFVLSIMSIFNIAFYYLFLSTIISYLSVIVVASFYISVKSRFLNILVLPFIFCALHFGFGIGFLIGAIRFFYHKIARILKK